MAQEHCFGVRECTVDCFGLEPSEPSYMGGAEAEAVCAGIRMNAGHLVLGYMPPFQAIMFPVGPPPLSS